MVRRSSRLLAAIPFLVAVLTAAPAASAHDAPPTPAYLKGIDVSHWNGDINWSRVARAGTTFAIIKASEGSRAIDNTYPDNRKAAGHAGVIVGAYHFARPDSDKNDAIREADNFVETARIRVGDLVPTLDLEVTGGLRPRELRAWVMTWLQRVRSRLGVAPMIYTSPTFWRRAMGDTSEISLAGFHVLWAAHWHTAYPTIPGDTWAGRAWTFWQYTDCGRVPGIKGCVDLNRFYGADLSAVIYQGSTDRSEDTAREITVAPARNVITWGQTLAIDVDMGSRDAYAPVLLETSGDAATGFTPIGSLVADSLGVATQLHRPATNVFYRATYARTERPAPGITDTSAEHRVIVRQVDILRPTSYGRVTTMKWRQSQTFTATVRPFRADLARAKVEFEVYRLRYGRWEREDRKVVKVDSSGTAKLKYRFRSVGKYYIRSRALATSTNASSLWSRIERYDIHR